MIEEMRAKLIELRLRNIISTETYQHLVSMLDAMY